MFLGLDPISLLNRSIIKISKLDNFNYTSYDYNYKSNVNTASVLRAGSERSCDRVRFPPMWPGFDSRTIRHIYVPVEFVVGPILSLLREILLRVLRFSPHIKNKHFRVPVRFGMHAHVLMSF